MSPSPVGTRPALSDDAAARLAALLSRGAGLVVGGNRRTSLSHDVAERLCATGLDLPDYLALVESAGRDGEAERAALIDEVAIGETSFFRNAPQMTALRDVLLPELLAAAGRRRRPLRIWSAGCSTGEEPYTLAMLLSELLENLPSSSRPEVELLATDVSRTAVAAAREGRYRGRSLRSAQRAGLARHFEQEGAEWRVRPEVRGAVRFARHNLVTEDPPFPAGTRVDLVLCRNVTIYFARDTTRSLVGRFSRCLTEGGYLVLGHAESLWQLSDEFSLVGYGDAFAYQRRTRDPPPLAVPAFRSCSPLPSPPRPRRASEAAAVLPAPPPPPLASGVRLLAAGAAEEALALACARITAEPMDALGHCLSGRALADLGRDAEAATALRAAVYADPTCGAAHFLLAVTLTRLRRIAAAATAYAAAGELLARFGDPGGLVGLEGRDVAELAALCRSRGARVATP